MRTRVETDRSGAHGGRPGGTEPALPINHFEGSYVCDELTLRRLQDEDRVVLRYVDNPNGSLDDIAGVCSAEGNVVGLMPHPERAAEAVLGSADGAVLLAAFLDVGPCCDASARATADDAARDLASALLAHAVRTGTFTLASGRTATWYLDARLVTFRGDCVDDRGPGRVADAVAGLAFDAVGGLTLGADPVALASGRATGHPGVRGAQGGQGPRRGRADGRPVEPATACSWSTTP